MPPFNNSTVYSNATAISAQGVPTCLQNSLPVKIGKIFVFSVILLSSLIGNALIVIIVYKRKELRKTLNYFIVNMAISDFIFPLTTILDTLFATANGSWQWSIHGTTGLIFCKLQNFLQQVSLAVSVGSLVWIAVDRFVAVLLPMKAHLISGRVRVFAIASTWFAAVMASCLDLYSFEMITAYNGETFCTDAYNTAYSNTTYKRVRTVLIHVAPLIALTILYFIIAVTLQKQDKALRSRAVHQKDKRKQRAIKMALCIMAAFYICTLPLLLVYILLEYEIVSISCLAWFLVYVMYYLSSTVNPVICMAFVQSYRLGLRSLFTSCRCLKRRLTTYSMETSEQGEITLQEIRVTGVEDNLAFSET